ncbi:MAG: hypothetical protein ABH824_04730 [Nanoarchaeota archaeon]|nr:hypothetical protein [Nanoarchaeota archaeon]MBU1632290.1 hypothetical protein [Nanoarchaeota archaeon]MBU1875765.1 hypothetical protein [Nanoarchaeota archaeon]
MRFHGFIFREIELFWTNIRRFFHNHKTLFDILFLSLYSIEQGILFISIVIFPEQTTKIITGFIITFITTISLEKICMESRYKELNDEITVIKVEYNKIMNENNDLRKTLAKNLKKDR